MNIETLLKFKSLYKITGTPENFLTALRFKEWGFNSGNLDNWNRIRQGDIVCFHCKKSDSYFIKDVQSCVVGFGIVGSLKYETTNSMWIEEFQQQRLIYPYHFNFSEIIFFGNVEINDNWDTQSLSKFDSTKAMINLMLADGIPLNQLPHFNPMGSFSVLNYPEIKNQLINIPKNFSAFQLESDSENELSTALTKINSVEDTFRESTSLIVMDEIRKKVINKKQVISIKDMTLLERAEDAHFATLDTALRFFKEKNFDCYSNKYVDLFACNNEQSFLIEVKSVENKNYRSQMRKAISQLLEYNYFEVPKFKVDSKRNALIDHRLVITSKEPPDNKYIQFINSLHIGVAAFKDSRLSFTGASINF